MRLIAWATRTLIVRQLKGLEGIIPVTVVSPRMDEHGWPFANIDPFPGADEDPVYGADHLKDVYLRVSPDYEGRFTVPLLFDKKTLSIVNNESSDIIRIFNSSFNHLLSQEKAKLDFYAEPLRNEIDELNAWVYDTVNSMLTLAYLPREDRLLTKGQMVYTSLALLRVKMRMRKRFILSLSR